MEHILQPYRDALVEELKAQGITDSSVLEAFRSIPRHRFVQAYYERKRGEQSWQHQTATDSQEWFEQIYSNRSFVTLIDAAGRTLSSSSQPSIMAVMLEALDVRPGQRVLEIGTGTGYNAALLAHLTGNPGLITTIDIDARTTEPAREVLSSLGYGDLTVLCADGRLGYALGAPYDRIIATASTSVIPEAWCEQLADGGRLVAILQPSIAMGGGVLQAEKDGDRLLGRLLCEATFMPLHDDQFEQQPSRYPHLDLRSPVVERFPITSRLFDTSIIWTSDFQFFLYATCPTLHIVEQQQDQSDRSSTLFFEGAEPATYVSFSEEDDQRLVELHGEKARTLWMQLVRDFTLWDVLGRPEISDYHFEMDAQGQYCFLQNDDGKVWPFVF